jgi:short-subunit dehydrogenase
MSNVQNSKSNVFKMKKNIVITGGTKGIGFAIAEIFAEAGYNLAICSRHENDLTEMKIGFAKRFPNITVFAMKADMSVKKEVLNFAAALKKEFHHINILINNAGIFKPGNISTEAEDALESMIAANLFSAYHLTRAVLPLMYGSEKAHIFNMCSVANLKAYPGGGSYSISKFALYGFSQNLRQELKSEHIKVTAVMPGATWSESWRGFDAPPERLMQAADIAKIIFSCTQLSDSAVVEDIILRPQLGDI